jgi:hypothetical protein
MQINKITEALLPNMENIVFLAALFPLIIAFRSTAGRAFLLAYLPSLLLLPDTFHSALIGIPKVSPNQAVSVTLLAFVLARHGRSWRVSAMDVLVFAMVATMSISEYLARDYKEAQNLTFAMIASCIAPYLIGRLLISGENLHVATARRFVILMFAVALMSVYEVRMGTNWFLDAFRPFFPGQGSWVPTFRYGFARMTGPFAHAILAGIIIAVAYRLQRWLEWGGHWEPRFQYFPNLPFGKARIITVTLLLCAIATLARGPWIGGFVGGLIMLIGRSQNRSAMMTRVLVIIALLLPPIYIGFNSYLEVQPGMKMTMNQESAIYRKELMEKYTDIAIEHLPLGWGRSTWPKVSGMPSIDNYFLLLTLMHGLITTLLFLSLFVWSGVRLLRMGMREPVGSNSLTFTFAGILIAILVSLMTVYLGEQVIPVTFLMLGWAEAHLQQPFGSGAQAPVIARAGPHFRVIR